MNNGNEKLNSEHFLAIEHYMKMAKSVNSKEDFLSKSKQFDKKFIDSLSLSSQNPHVPKSANNQHQKKKSPPKNPFRHPTEEKYLQSQRKNYQKFSMYSEGNKSQMKEGPNFQKNTKYPKQYGGQIEQLESNFVNQFTMNNFTNQNTNFSNFFPNTDPNQIQRSTVPFQPQGFYENEEQHLKYYKKLLPEFQTERTNEYKFL